MEQTVTADAEVSEEHCTKICDSMASATAEQYAEDAQTCKEDDESPRQLCKRGRRAGLRQRG